MSRATRAEIAEWEARLEKVKEERDQAERRAEVAERRIVELEDETRGADAISFKMMSLAQNVAAMGAALAQKVEGKG